MKNVLIFVLCIILVGCGFEPDKAEIYERILSAINVEVLEGYELVNSVESSATDDYIQEFTIKFNEDSYRDFIGKIDLSKWVTNENGYEFFRKIDLRNTYAIYLNNSKKTLTHVSAYE